MKMKCKKRNNSHCRVCFDAIGVSARLMATFSGFYESHEPPPSGDALGIAPPHCDGHQNGQQSGYILHNRCCLGGRRGNTEGVVVQWRRSVASGEALVMLHWVMCFVSHRCTAMAIKMARDRGAFVHHCCLFQLL